MTDEWMDEWMDGWTMIDRLLNRWIGLGKRRLSRVQQHVCIRSLHSLTKSFCFITLCDD
jgi:hypothetical protein